MCTWSIVFFYLHLLQSIAVISGRIQQKWSRGVTQYFHCFRSFKSFHIRNYCLPVCLCYLHCRGSDCSSRGSTVQVGLIVVGMKLTQYSIWSQDSANVWGIKYIEQWARAEPCRSPNGTGPKWTYLIPPPSRKKEQANLEMHEKAWRRSRGVEERCRDRPYRKPRWRQIVSVGSPGSCLWHRCRQRAGGTAGSQSGSQQGRRHLPNPDWYAGNNSR